MVVSEEVIFIFEHSQLTIQLEMVAAIFYVKEVIFIFEYSQLTIQLEMIAAIFYVRSPFIYFF
jgi:hypothetical protein